MLNASSRCLAFRSPAFTLLLALAPACDAGSSSLEDEGAAGQTSVSPSAGVAGQPATAGAPGGTSGGGAPNAGGAPGGAPAAGGTPSSGGAGAPTVAGASGASTGSGLPGSFGDPTQSPKYTTTDQYDKVELKRDGVNYYFMANGWGENWQSHEIALVGTSFTIKSLQGTEGRNYSPASYPTVFCGAYSDSLSGQCGLPALLSDIKSIKTGWSWAANGNTGQYNAAYDIWIGNTADGKSGDAMRDLTDYVMVWYRDPPGQQPAGQRRQQGITVPGVEGTWDYWQGQVGGKPYYAYVKPEGQDIHSFEFDAMAFINDLPARNATLRGNTVLSVAVGFEIWNGPVTNLASQDFYVAVE